MTKTADSPVAFSYGRVSTQEQASEDATSLASQKDRTLLHVGAQGWRHGGHFEDPGVSGAKPFEERPGGAALLEAIEEARREGREVRVVALKVDRFTRSLRHGAEQLGRWADEGIGFVSVTETFDTSTTQGKLFLGILMLFADFERETIAARNEDGRRAIVEDETYQTEDGLRVWRWVTGRLPLGYETDADKRIVIDEEHAPAVRLIFELRGQGLSTNAIGEELRRQGITARPWGKAVGAFSNDLVGKVLSDGTYIGNGVERSLGGGAPSTTFDAPAIITLAAWKKAHRPVKGRKTVEGAGEKRHDYALSERLVHIHDDDTASGMFGTARPAKGGARRWYRCSASRPDAKGNPATCDGFGEVQQQNMTSVQADLIEAATLRFILMQRAEDWAAIVEHAREAEGRASGPFDREAAEKAIERLRHRLARVQDGHEAGTYSTKEAAERVARLRAEIEGVETDIENAKRRGEVQALRGVTIEELLAMAIVDNGERDENADEMTTAETRHRLLRACAETLQAPDRYGRTPALSEEARDEVARLARLLDLRVYVGASDDPRRPNFWVDLAEDAVTARGSALKDSGVSAWRTACRGGSGRVSRRPPWRPPGSEG